jgi:hypothetical protein
MGIALALLLLIIAVSLIGTLPLYLAVHVLGGDATFVKVLIVKIAAAVLAVVLTVFLNKIGALIAGVLTLFIYKFMFDLGFFRAIMAWLIEGVFMVVLVFLASYLGIAAVSGLA